MSTRHRNVSQLAASFARHFRQIHVFFLAYRTVSILFGAVIGADEAFALVGYGMGIWYGNRLWYDTMVWESAGACQSSENGDIKSYGYLKI